MPSAQAEIVRDEGSTLTLDGRRALGQVVCTLAADLAAGRALEHGVAPSRCGTRDTSGAWPTSPIARAARRAAVLLFANDSGASQEVAPPGAREARLSTNPLAAGIPRARAPHLVMDLSTSVAAHGKVQVCRSGGRGPETWMRDGLLQPLGGAKGFALGLLVEALAGVVSGAGAASASPGPDDQGVFLLAFDPARFGRPGDVAERLEAMLDYVSGCRCGRARSLCVHRAHAAAAAARPGARFEIARRWPSGWQSWRRARRRSGQALMKRLPGS